MDKSEMDLGVIIGHFDVHNRSEGKSPRTTQWYNEVLHMFYRWLKESRCPTNLGAVGDMEVRRFIIHIQEKPGIKGPKMSSHTIVNRVRALKAFFAWLARLGYTQKNVLENLRTPKALERVIEPLTKEEVDKLFGAINPSSAMGARNSSLLSLMLDTGLRLSEVASIKESDVHLGDHYVKVLGKGSKERLVAFGVACQRSLLHYLSHFRGEPAHPMVDSFFLTIDGYPMTGEAIKSFMDRLSKSAKVGRLHPHLLRHTYATCFLLNGGDVFTLKHNLGHSSLAMVEHYLHVAGQVAAVRSQGFSPLDRFNVSAGRRYAHGFGKSAKVGARIYPNGGIKQGRRGRTRP